MPTENRSNGAGGWIACDDGLHLIQMDKNLSHYGWVFRKIDGGLPYSVREATAHEMAHAQARQHLRIGVAQITEQAPAELHQGHIKSLEALNQQTEKQRDHWMAECKKRDAQLAERDALLREHSGKLIVLAARLLQEPLRALNGDLDSDGPITRIKVTDGVERAGDSLGGLAAEVRRVADALSASAEPASTAWRCEPCSLEMADKRICDLCGAAPCAPVERDERAAYDAWCHSESGYVRPFNMHEWSAWQARAALDRKS